MANETTVQTSCIQESHETDECRENIPPGVVAATGATKLKLQVEDMDMYSSTQPSGENEPLSDSCSFSTPAPTSGSGGVKAKSRLSSLGSALTPILKYLNIGNKCASPESVKQGKSPRLMVPPLPPGRSSDSNAPACCLADECLPEITLLDVTCDASMQMTKNDSALPDSMPSTPVIGGSMKSPFTTPKPSKLGASTSLKPAAQIPCPQIKTQDLKNGTRAQAAPVSKNTTMTSPVKNGSAVKASDSCAVQDATFERPFVQKSSSNTNLEEAGAKQTGTITRSETSSSDSCHTSVDKASQHKVCNTKESHSQVHSQETSNYSEDCDAEMVDIPERIHAPLRCLDDRFFPEITLLDVTRDSDFSPRGEMSALDATQDISPSDGLQKSALPLELSGPVAAQSGTLDMIPSEDLSSTLDGNATHTISSISEQSDRSVGDNTPKVSLEVTRDISMSSLSQDSLSSLDPSGQSISKMQTSAEETHPANVTHDISSSSDGSVQCAVPQVSASNMQCNTSPMNVTCELQVEPVLNSSTVDATKKEPLSNHNKVPQPSPKQAGSGNNTFTAAEQSSLSVSTSSTSVNTSAQIPQNKTLDLPQSDVNTSKAESAPRDQGASASKTTKTSPVIDQNSLVAKAHNSCLMQNVTFDRHSLHKSSSNSTLGEAGAATFNIRNNTFDTKSPSKQNGAIAVSEISSSDGHQNTFDKPSSPPKECNATSSPKNNISQVQPAEQSKHNGTAASTEPDAKMVDAPESTSEANPVAEVTSGAGRSETKDQSQLDQPVREGLSDTFGHQSMDMDEDNKVNTLNLDDTLDLKADQLVTSTPMISCKIFNFHTDREEGKAIAAQKKLYRDVPTKPDAQVLSDVPSNIVSDRKTFLTQPAAKSLLPPLKAPSQLLKYKPASLLPGKFEPMTSGLPMTRQRTQAEALKNTAASDATHATTGISTPYNLRGTTAGSKLPNPGLQKPRLSGIPSGIQRALPGLRPLLARSNAMTVSSTDKLRGPTATNPAVKSSQAKKHPLTRGEALPTAKRKKTDAAVPAGGAEASVSSCDAANRAKNQKVPTTSHRALPVKTQRDDTAVPASTADASTSCTAVSRGRALKQPVTSHRAVPPKPQSHGCAKCSALERQLEMKSEEIKRLKEELLKYQKQ